MGSHYGSERPRPEMRAFSSGKQLIEEEELVYHTDAKHSARFIHRQLSYFISERWYMINGVRLKINLTAEFWSFRIRFLSFLDAFAVSRVGVIKYLYNNQIGVLYFINFWYSSIYTGLSAYPKHVGWCE